MSFHIAPYVDLLKDSIGLHIEAHSPSLVYGDVEAWLGSSVQAITNPEQSMENAAQNEFERRDFKSF